MAMRLASHDPDDAPQARAVRPRGPRRVRCARAGARRGAGLRPHARHDRQHLRDARGPAVPRQSRRGQRPRRRAARGSARPDAARKDRRPRPCRRRATRWSSSGATEIDAKGAAVARRRCSTSFENQELFARAAQAAAARPQPRPRQRARRRPMATTSDGGDDQEPEKGEDSDKTPEQGEGESEDSDAEEDQTPGDSDETGDTEGAEADMAESDEEVRRGRRRLAEPAAARRQCRARHEPVQLQDLHPEVRRDRQGLRALPARRARPAPRAPRQAAREPCGRRRAARQQAPAPADGAAEPQLGVRPRGGPARHRAPHPRRHRSAAGAELQGRAGHRFPRHRGDAADRQFRLDARPPDHHRGDLRRHPRAHPRALRRQGRDPRLHHPRLEGRQEPRGLARSRTPGQSRPRQRHPPHHLQGRRRAVAPRPAQPRPDDARGPAQGEHRRRSARSGRRSGCRRGPKIAAS